MRIIYGIESNSALTGKRRLNVTFYVEWEQAHFAAQRIDPIFEPEIVEFNLDETEG